MISVKFNANKFIKDMNNFIEYNVGFIDGAQKAKPVMMKNLAIKIEEILGNFIDTMARVDPQRLHHIYEWYQTGSPNARLFEINYVTTNGGLTFSYTFSQSTSISRGSKEPFYNKAMIMENGVPVTIAPQSSKVLVFEQDGKTVFTRKPITIEHPGGDNVRGSFAATVKMFFSDYLSQSMLDVTGIRAQLRDMSEYKRNVSKSKNGGYSLGVRTGEQWISKVGTIE